eukprot:gene20730-biopygen10131
MSWVGPHAIRPRNHTPGGDDFSPIICLGLGPQLCLRPRPVARARIPEGRAPFYGPKSGICLGLGPQLHGPEPIRLEATLWPCYMSGVGAPAIRPRPMSERPTPSAGASLPPIPRTNAFRWRNGRQSGSA